MEEAGTLSEMDVSIGQEIPDSQAAPARAEHKKLLESNGEIGYSRNQTFVPLTNFAVKCTGYVVDDVASTSANGFLFQVLPKDSVRVEGENEKDELTR